MACDDRRVYKARKTLWVQRPMTYGQFLRVLRLLRDKFRGLTDVGPATVGDWIDSLDTDGTLPKLVDEILSPYEPTPLHRLWNRFWAWRGGVRKPIVTHMQARTVAQVMMDFFLLNTSWLSDLLNLKIGTRSLFRRRMTVAEAITSLSSFYGMTQAGTISRPGSWLGSLRSTSSSGSSSASGKVSGAS